MKLTFDRELLISKLKLNASFIPKKAVIPAHTLVLFECDNNVVKMTAQNGVMQIINTTSVLKSSGNGSFTIPGKVLLQTISLMKEPEVTITYKDGKCEVKSGKSKYKFSSDDGSDHVRMARIDRSEFEASFAGSVINMALETSVRYSDKENVNVWSQGVCLRSDGNKINFFASNMHSVSKISISPRSINNWADIIVPEETCKAIIRCVNDIDIVDILHNKKSIEIISGDVVIISSVLDCKFPNVEEFYKKKPSNNIVLNTVEVAHAIDRLKLVAREDAPAVTFDIGTDGITMISEDPDFGNSGEEHVSCISPKESRMGFNITLLSNILESFSNDTFTFTFDDDPKKPAFFEPIDNISENNKFFLIAPTVV